MLKESDFGENQLEKKRFKFFTMGGKRYAYKYLGEVESHVNFPTIKELELLRRHFLSTGEMKKEEFAKWPGSESSSAWSCETSGPTDCLMLMSNGHVGADYSDFLYAGYLMVEMGV